MLIPVELKMINNKLNYYS